MANYSVKHLTEEERAELRKQDPDREILEFQIVNEQGIVVDYLDSEQEARSLLDGLTKHSLVEDAFRDWALKTAEEVGMSREEVITIAQDCC